MNRTEHPLEDREIAHIVVTGAGLCMSPLALLAANLLAPKTRLSPIRATVAGIVGAVAAYLLAPMWSKHALAFVRDPSWLDAVLWSLAGLPAAAPLAAVTELVRPRSVEEHRKQTEAKTDRDRRRAGKRAARKAAQAPPKLSTGHAVLGRHVGGDSLLAVRKGWAAIPLERLGKHMLVLGSSGSGKTETLLRLAYSVAKTSDWRIYYIDGKGDRKNAERFTSLMTKAGRTPKLFPDSRYDGWRGNEREIANRLVELIDYADEGGGAYYRDLATNLIRVACAAPPGPPRSAHDLQQRLNADALRKLYTGTGNLDATTEAAIETIGRYTDRQVAEVALRYEAFFGAVYGDLDGGWAYEDADAGYMLIDGLGLKHEAGNLARFLIEDFTQYVSQRKSRGQRVLLIVDEFSAIASAGSSLVDVIERTRGFGVAAVLAPQVMQGMGGKEAAARIVGSTHTTLLHSIPDPETIIGIAGTRLAAESSLQHDHGFETGAGSARLQHTYRVDPNEVRALVPGVCFALGSGRGQRLHITRAPHSPSTRR